MPEKKENIVVYEYDPENPPPLTPEQIQELEELAKMPDSEIDYSDIPEITDFSGFHRVKPRSSFVDQGVNAEDELVRDDIDWYDKCY